MQKNSVNKSHFSWKLGQDPELGLPRREQLLPT